MKSPTFAGVRRRISLFIPSTPTVSRPWSKLSGKPRYPIDHVRDDLTTSNADHDRFAPKIPGAISTIGAEGLNSMSAAITRSTWFPSTPIA
jgi:hypothetical protein